MKYCDYCGTQSVPLVHDKDGIEYCVRCHAKYHREVKDQKYNCPLQQCDVDCISMSNMDTHLSEHDKNDLVYSIMATLILRNK